jgi:DNA-binding NarL/FixJ family response regulator
MRIPQGAAKTVVRILLIDDHPLFRDGLKFLLAGLADGLDFLEADSCESALAHVAAADIILLDLKLPGVNGIEALRAIREASETVTVVVLSSEDDPRVIRRLIDAGAAGFIPKSSTQGLLIAALRLVLAGGSYLPPHVLNSPTTTTNPDTEAATGPLSQLSERQREVVMYAVQGKPNKRIARDLAISEATVKSHLSSAFRILGVRNRTEAVFAVANAPAEN